MTGTKGGRLPDFLVVGAMRSGTTSLFRYLEAHPEIAMVDKELGFFTERFDEGIDWYKSRFAAAGSARVLGEATADYLARESAMNRIADVLPAVRLVASLRNPIERTWSHYGLLQARGRETRSFEEALDAEEAALAEHGPNAPGVIYLYHSDYGVHLERAFRLFGDGQIHVSIFERMVSDPAATYRSICGFLGVDDTYVPPNLGRAVNPHVGFRSLRVRSWSKRLPTPLRRVVARVNTKQAEPRPDLDPAVRARLAAFFAPRVARVEELLGDELSEWRA